jgi:hypothetical protein
MARIESTALGGYYATPPHLVPRIASLLSLAGDEDRSRSRATILDPCAADGEAVIALVEALVPVGLRFSTSLYTCELEATRHKALITNLGEKVGYDSVNRALQGDAFRATFSKGDRSGVSVLYLNPPYDLDPIHGRLEERFLARFAPTLAEDGVLLFIVPFYALKASAQTLARDFIDLRCFRFPEGDFEGYKQVVLVARRRQGLFEPDAQILADVQRWAADASSLPELPSGGDPLYQVPVPESAYDGGLATWAMREIDVTTLLKKVRPWHHSTRTGTLLTTPNILPELPVQDLLLRRYPVATPPRPAHIAAGIASGLFNGARIEPTDRTSKLPSLLVKGVFDREYKTVEEKQNKDGEVRAVVQVQQPRLITTVLDLSTRKYHVLGSSTETTGTKDVANMGVADLLSHYGDSLMTVMERQCPILYDPRRDADSIKLPPSPRRLFSAQSHAVKAIVKLLGGPTAGRMARRGKAAILLGEIGSGKSTVALMAAQTIGARRVLVMCPPHLLKSWTNEVASVQPDAEVRILTNVADVDAIVDAPADGPPIIAVLSRETAKLSHGWTGAGSICPTCGQPTPTDIDLAKKRARCTHKRLLPRDKSAHLALRLAQRLMPSSPQCGTIHTLLRSRFDRERTRRYAEAHDSGRAHAFVMPTTELIDALDALIDRDWNSFSKDASRALVGVLASLQDDAQVVRVARHLVAQRATCGEYGFSSYESESFLRALPLLLAPGSDAQNALVEELKETAKARSYSYGSSGPWTGWGDTIRVVQTRVEGSPVGDAAVSWLGGQLKVLQREAGSSALAREALRLFAKTATFAWSAECGEILFQAIPEPRRTALARYISRRHPRLFDFLVLDECFVAGTKVSGHPIESIRVGDIVDSYDESTGRHVTARVSRLWKKVPTALVRVHFTNDSSFVCTPNHPIFANGAWTPAGQLVGKELVLMQGHASEEHSVGGALQEVRETPAFGRSTSDYTNHKGLCILQPNLCGVGVCTQKCQDNLGGDLSSVPKADHADRAGSRSPTKTRLRVLYFGVCTSGQERGDRSSEQHSNEAQRKALLRSDEVRQPHEKPRHRCEDAREVGGAHIPVQRWEWSTDSTASTSCRGTRVAHGSSHYDCAREESVPVSSELLQGRSSSQRAEDCSRGGWGVTQAQEVALLGSTEGRGSPGTRVDRVEILERGCDGTFGDMCPDGFVYNLEVEGTHTYFAEAVLVHNCHEYATDGSAQERSAHRLTALGLPTVSMTGTIMNGYAASLFTNMWSLSPDFRDEFARDEGPRFIDRYGYRKRIVEDRDKVSGEIVEYGSNSDRVTRSERVIGNAPGILPLFLLRHLLPISVTLHKTDLAIDLPPCTQHRHLIDPGGDLQQQYESLKTALVARIKKDRYDEDLAGKLWGQLAELPSYLDRATADVGNMDSGAYEIHYPASVGGQLVAAATPLPATSLLPKEEWMLALIERELREGRNVMVFSWHVKLLPRIARIISERIGEPVPILYAEKVPTGKRQDWIDREVVRKHRHVLVTNPVAIQTGLNNLVHFATEVWMENPACNPTTFRQAIGRVDRIGQKIETRIHFPIYANTMQGQLYDLLMKKVAVSISTDGLDPESALQAAGVGEDGILTGMSIGKQLWSMLTEGTNVEDPSEPVYRAGSTTKEDNILDLMDRLDAMATG